MATAKKQPTKPELVTQIKGLEAKTAGLKSDLKAAEEKIVTLETTTVPKEKLSAEGLLEKIRWFLEDKGAFVRMFVTVLTVILPMAFAGFTVGDLVGIIQDSQDFVNNLYGILVGTLLGTGVGVSANISPKK
jgi:adenosylcobinamide amidohydrolase